jgi:hypothetical protein
MGDPKVKIFVLSHTQARQNALRAVAEAPEGYEVRIAEKRRSLDQNAHLWAVLTDISQQVEWHGQFLSPEDWKHILTAGLKREQRMAPGVNGGWVVLGLSTSKMTKSEFSELLELAYAFGSEKGVHFELSQQETA